MTRGLWIGSDGWPIDYPAGLLAAIRNIPGCSLTDAQVDTLARCLAEAENEGREAAAPHSQSKSAVQNEAALRAMHDLCERLGGQIESLPREAFQSLVAEGLDVASLRKRLAEAQEDVRHAFGEMIAPSVVAGRPVDVRARMVADEAAEVYIEVSSTPPTYTTNPLANEVPRRVGPWPEFLARVFATLMVDANTDSHVERIAKNK
jgi:hypothetical protein